MTTTRLPFRLLVVAIVAAMSVHALLCAQFDKGSSVVHESDGAIAQSTNSSDLPYNDGQLSVDDECLSSAIISPTVHVELSNSRKLISHIVRVSALSGRSIKPILSPPIIPV